MSVEATSHAPTALRIESLRGPRVAAFGTLVVLVAFLAVGLVWAGYAQLDEVTPGAGKVIPSRQVQVIQNLEGGIVSGIMVKEGDRVGLNQILMRIDDTAAGASLREQEELYWALLASTYRLQAEADGSEPRIPPAAAPNRPDIVKREMELYHARKREHESVLSVLQQQRAQRVQELEEMQSRLKTAQESHQLIRQEYDLTKPLVDKGVVSRVELLRLERQVTDFQAQINQATINIPKTRAGITEVDQRVRERRDNFRTEALKDLGERRARIASLQESIAARKDRVVRTEVRAPVDGVVKQVNVTTIGGIVQPGQELMSIVPLEDTLVVEAQVNPRDVAFLHPGQKAVVKLTAYDFTVYGGIEATLENIGADTIVDKQGNSFYQIRVRTNRTRLERPGHDPLPIIPGMVAQVDIMTGKKTVLEYLLKPLIKARYTALRER